MPVLDYDPGQSPEAPGILFFYEQGQDPLSGFAVTSRGAIVSTVAAAYTGASAAADVITARVSGDAGQRFVINADGKLEWGDGTGPLDVNLYRSIGTLRTDVYMVLAGGGQSNADFICYTGSARALVAGSVGGGLSIAEGANARMGRSTLVAGTVVVANTSVTANTEIFVMCQTPGGTPGFLRVSARTAATSFTILSSSGTDTSVVGWLLVEPSL